MTPYLADPDVTLYHGDCLEVLRTLPDRSVHMCATSPPFYGLRDYGTEGQIGLEETPDQWVERLVAVFREVRRVLRDDGTLWVEIGDSYCANDAGKGRPNEGHVPNAWQHRDVDIRTKGGAALTPMKHPTKPKDLLGQPWLLAKALRDPYYTGAIKSESDRVWLAAMLDAEGCIGIHKRPAGQSAYSSFDKADGTTSEYVRKTDSYQPKVEITNTTRAIMDRVVAVAGGNCDTKQEAGTHGRKQTIYRWTVTADKARDLLREVYPHLVGKQHEARLAYGCPSSGDGASEAHESLKALHRGDAVTFDFAAPESLWEAGWFLRSEIIWARLRPNPMPESVTDRPTKSHSTVFLLSKRPRYFYDADAIREPSSAMDTAPRSTNGQRERTDKMRGFDTRVNTGSANARSVWQIPTEPTPFAHFATWPRKLVARMILAGTSERGCCPECGAPWVRETNKGFEPKQAYDNGQRYASLDERHAGGWKGSGRTVATTLGWSRSCDCVERLSADDWPVPCTVLDPFAGSGTTLLVARHHGRRSIGIELNETYCQLVAERTQQQSLLAEGAA